MSVPVPHVLLALALIAAAAPAGLRRELLASGDEVAALGRVGNFSAELRGIDDHGRLLVAADLSDGSAALYWLDERGFELLPVAGSEATLVPASSVASPAGRIAVRGVRPGESSNPPASVFVLDDGAARLVLSVGDTTEERLYVAWINHLAAIADDGTVVIGALVSTTAGPVPLGETSSAILAVDAAGARVVAGSGDAIPSERRFDGAEPIGVTTDGVVLFNGWLAEQRTEIFAADATGLRMLLRPGDRLPSGRPLREVHGLAASPDGEVLLRGCVQTAAPYPRRRDCTLYRTSAGRLLRVAGPSDRTPDGALFDSDEGFLGVSGDVVLNARWLASCRDEPDGLCERDQGLLYLPAAGGIRQIGRGVSGGWLNAAGAVGTAGASGLGRWRAGEAVTLLRPDNVAPNGAGFAARGLDDAWQDGVCIAEDGRVGAVVSFRGTGRALVCMDGDGVHAVLRESDPRLEGWGFWPSVQCAFADRDEMYVGAGGSVFRVTTRNGVERVIGPGDVPVGADYRRVRRLGELDTDQVFSVNRHGTVVAMSDDDVLRRRPGGPLEVVNLAMPGRTVQIDVVSEAEVADDDSVVVTGHAWDDRHSWSSSPTRVVHVDGDVVRVLARRGPRYHPSAAVLDGPPRSVQVAGWLVAFLDDADGYPRPLLYDLDGGAIRELLAGPNLPAWGYLLDVAAAGEALLDTEHYGYGRFYFDGSRLTRLSERDEFADREVEPVALGARGIVLFHERQRGRHSLTVSGPPATGRCPRLDLAGAPTPTPSATPNFGSVEPDACAVVAPRPTAWPLLAGAVLLAFGRRRGQPMSGHPRKDPNSRSRKGLWRGRSTS